MKPFVLALLMVIPIAMAGLPPDMEYLFRNMMKGGDSDGGHSSGEDKGHDGGMSGDMSFDMDEMMKMMKKWVMHKDDDDKDKYEWEKERGWYSKDSDESSEPRELGDMDSGDKEEDYGKFMKWISEEKKKSKGKDHDEEEMREKIMEFKSYLKDKKNMKHEMEEKKRALFKQMQMIQQKKMMTEHLYDVSMDFMKRKMSFTFDVLSRFMGLCDCHDSLDLFKRIKNGRFGYDDYDDGHDDDGKGDDMGDRDMPGGDDDDSGDKDDDKGEMYEFHKPTEEEMMEIVMKFLYMSRENRLKHVLHDVVKVMCGGAKQFFAHMKQVEHYLIEYRKHHHGNDH